MFKSIDNFFVPVEDMDAARQYYCSRLGMPVKFDFSDRGMLGCRIGEGEPAIILKEKSRFPETKPTIWFVVEDVKITYQHLREKGVNFLSEPYEIKTGLSVEFEDPFGNRLGITDYTPHK